LISSDRGLAVQEISGWLSGWMTPSKVRFNAAAAGGNGQFTDVSEFREVIIYKK